MKVPPCLVYVVLENKCRAPCLLDKFSPVKLHPSPEFWYISNFWFVLVLFLFCLFLMSLNLPYDLISYYSFMGKEPIDNGYTVKRRVRLNWFKQGLNSSTVARKPRKPVVTQSLRSWNTQNNRANAPTTVRGYSLSLPFKSWSLVWCTCL